MEPPVAKINEINKTDEGRIGFANCRIRKNMV